MLSPSTNTVRNSSDNFFVNQRTVTYFYIAFASIISKLRLAQKHHWQCRWTRIWPQNMWTVQCPSLPSLPIPITSTPHFTKETGQRRRSDLSALCFKSVDGCCWQRITSSATYNVRFTSDCRCLVRVSSSPIDDNRNYLQLFQLLLNRFEIQSISKEEEK